MRDVRKVVDQAKSLDSSQIFGPVQVKAQCFEELRRRLEAVGGGQPEDIAALASSAWPAKP